MHVAAHPLDLLVHHRSEGFEAREIGVCVALVLDDVLGPQEVRHRLIGARQLGDHIGLASALLAIDELAVGGVIGLQGEFHRVIVDGVHARQLGPGQGQQAGQLVGGLGPLSVQGGDGGRTQLALGAGPRAGVQAQPGDQLRNIVQGRLVEGLQQDVEAVAGRGGALGQGGGNAGAAGEGQGASGGEEHLTAGLQERTPLSELLPVLPATLERVQQKWNPVLRRNARRPWNPAPHPTIRRSRRIVGWGLRVAGQENPKRRDRPRKIAVSRDPCQPSCRHGPA